MLGDRASRRSTGLQGRSGLSQIVEFVTPGTISILEGDFPKSCPRCAGKGMEPSGEGQSIPQGISDPAKDGTSRRQDHGGCKVHRELTHHILTGPGIPIPGPTTESEESLR